MKVKNKIKNFFVYALAIYFSCLVFEFVCHPSKNPTFFGLYSTSKFFGILVFLTAALLTFYFFINKRRNDIRPQNDLPTYCLGRKFPSFIILSILFISYILKLNTSFSAGVDFATQLKATLQWSEGLTQKWNHLIQTDLNLNDTETWLFRPPAATFYYVPFLYLPIPLGESLRLAQLILGLTICLSWIRISKILHFKNTHQNLLALVLAIWVTNSLSFAGNVQLLATAYSSLCSLYALKFLNNINKNLLFNISNFTHLLTISICFGAIVLIKVSAIVFNFTLFCAIFVILYSSKFKKSKLLLTFIPSAMCFCTPYFILNLINRSYGVELDSVYQQDYNNQWFTKELWGDYFTETTQLPAVLLSLFGSISTFSPFHPAQTLISNLLTYMEYFDSFILSLELNPKVIYKSLTGTFFSSLFLYLFISKESILANIKLNLLFIISIPFIIFTYLSYKHGYNYLITGTYNQQYLPPFILIILWITNNHISIIDKKTFLSHVLFFLSLGIFTYANSKNFTNSVKTRFESTSLTSNHINHIFFGDNISVLEETIVKHRKSFESPIIYIGNSSIEEMSIVFTGKYTGVSNMSILLENNTLLLPNYTNHALLVVDARISDEEMRNLKTILSKRKYSFLLNLSKTAKVIAIEG